MEKPLTPEEHEQQKQALELEQLRIETEQLRRSESRSGRLMEKLKSFAGLGGLVTAIIAISAFLFSYYQWNIEQQEARQQQTRERMENHLVALSNESPARRLSAVISLQGYLYKSAPEQQRQIVLSLVSILSIDPESSVRNAIIQTLETADTAKANMPVLAQGLKTLAGHSRNLVIDLELYRQVPNPYNSHPDSALAIVQDISVAIETLLRKGVRTSDLSSTYLVGLDFSNLDLTGVSFEDAICPYSNFDGVIMPQANFDGADITETTFIGATLPQAKFTYTDFKRARYHANPCNLWLNNETLIIGPDFADADLRGADFGHFFMFPFMHDHDPFNGYYPPNFQGAQLDSVKFDNCYIYGATPGILDREFPFEPLSEGSYGAAFRDSSQFDAQNPEHWMTYHYLSDKFQTATPYLQNCQGSQADLRASFQGSNWKDAYFNPAIRQMLTELER